MAGEVSPLMRLLQQITENPAVLRELAPMEGEMAAKIPMEQLSGPDVTDLLTRTRGRLAEWLSGRAESQPGPFSKPAASIVRSQGPTSGPPAAPAMSPSPSPTMDLMKKLQAYAPYGRSYGEDVKGVQFPETEFKTTGEAEPTPEATVGDPLRAMRQQKSAAQGAAGPPTMAQGPSMTSPAEMLRRPAGGERSELITRVQDYLDQLKSGEGDPEEIMPALKRIKPQLMPPVDVDPRTREGLQRMGAAPEAQFPEPAPDQPVTRQDYRGAPRASTYNESLPERFKSEGLSKTELPPEFQEKLKQLVASGQLEPEVYGSENVMRDILAKMYGYKPRALVGGAKTVGEAAPSRTGLMVKKMADMSPEETQKVLGSIRPSGIMQEGQRAARAESAADQYKALGDTRDPKEIVADLLRGGPSPTGMSEFSQKVLYPVLKKRGKLGLPQGQPMTLEDVLGALRGSRFLRSDQPSPVREQFLAKVLQMMKARGAK